MQFLPPGTTRWKDKTMSDYLDTANECLGGYDDFELDDSERARRRLDELWSEYLRSGYWPAPEPKPEWVKE